MAAIVHSKLYYAILKIAKSENIGSRLQFASIVGCRTRSVEIDRVVFAWCKLLPILRFRLFLVAIVRYYYIELNRQIPYKLASVQILKMQNGH